MVGKSFTVIISIINESFPKNALNDTMHNNIFRLLWYLNCNIPDCSALSPEEINKNVWAKNLWFIYFSRVHDSTQSLLYSFRLNSFVFYVIFFIFLNKNWNFWNTTYCRKKSIFFRVFYVSNFFKHNFEFYLADMFTNKTQQYTDYTFLKSRWSRKVN